MTSCSNDQTGRYNLQLTNVKGATESKDGPILVESKFLKLIYGYFYLNNQQLVEP
jgi:hypothetical protein